LEARKISITRSLIGACLGNLYRRGKKMFERFGFARTRST
jgi:hypothetical protein